MIAEVIVDILNSEVDRIFDYSCPDNTPVGMRVFVPFGNRRAEGYIIGLKDSSDLPPEKIKDIYSFADNQPILTEEMLKLSQFLIKKYNLRKMDTIRLFLPVGIRKNRVKEIIIKSYQIADKTFSDFSLFRKSAKNQIEAVKYLLKNNTETQTELNKMFGNAAIKKLEQMQIILPVFSQRMRTPTARPSENEVFELTQTQKTVIKKIEEEQGKTFLLHGVTGSGKTEVYMNIIKGVVEKGKTAIMLVPEISLTPQVMRNFVARFASSVAILHSGLSQGERFDEWHRILNGDAKIVVGARSGIFAPLKDIGVIIIDEEHDGSYFSETSPRYYTHDVAKFRSKYNNCNLILGSATPSLESYFKAEKGEYTLLNMPERINKNSMPPIEIADMTSEIKSGNTSIFSNLLLNTLSQCIEDKEQAILFLNRRGYTSFVMCKECGYTAKCQDCDVSLVYHKEDGELKCHYCSRRYLMLSQCPECGSKYIRQGYTGTQKVAEELQQIFPKVKIFRMDNDNTGTKNAHEEILRKFSETKPSILVGTQMIAKGHDFPLVTVVGIIDADLSLHFSDYRAGERTFNLITQVAGRAGRREKAGKVILQTYSPRHYIYRYASEYDYKKFYGREINLRNTTNFPPFCTVVRLLITGSEEEKSKEQTKVLWKKITTLKEEHSKDFIYAGFMKSPVRRIQNKYRYQILLRIGLQNSDEIISNIFKIVNESKSKKTTTFVEINPQNLS